MGSEVYRMTNTIRRAACIGCAAVLAFSLNVGAAFATDSAATAVLTGGTLGQTGNLAAGSFAGTLNGSAQSLSGTGFTGFQVTDYRGSGIGWVVSAQATKFVNRTYAGKDLAYNSFTMPQVGVSGVASATVVPGTLHASAHIDTGSTAVVMVSTSVAGQGMGLYNFTTPAGSWKLDIAGDSYAGSYDSTVTLTVATL